MNILFKFIALFDVEETNVLVLACLQEYAGWGNSFVYLEYMHYFKRYEEIVITKIIWYQEDHINNMLVIFFP